MIVNPLRIFATLFLAAVGVSGQSQLDGCIQTCLSSSVSNDTCTAANNLTCVCTNTGYQTAVLSCLTANCTTTDQATAKALQQTECAALTNSTSNSTSSKSLSHSSTSTTPTASSSSGSSSKSGAINDQVPFLNAAFALATVALGGAFLL